MVVVINITFGILFVSVVLTSCFFALWYTEMRKCTFGVEQSLLQCRPDVYIPPWRRHQGDKNTPPKGSSGRKSGTNLVDEQRPICRPKQAPPEGP